MQLDNKHKNPPAHLMVAHKRVHEIFSVGRQTHQHGYYSNPNTQITRIRVVYQAMISLI